MPAMDRIISIAGWPFLSETAGGGQNLRMFREMSAKQGR